VDVVREVRCNYLGNEFVIATFVDVGMESVDGGDSGQPLRYVEVVWFLSTP